MSQYWLYIDDDSSATLDLDNEINELTLGGNKRRFKFIDYAGAPGSILQGQGNVSKKMFIVTRTERAEDGDVTAWNSRRNDFMKFFTQPYYKDVYLYCQDGEQGLELRTKVYVEEIPADKYKNYRISDKRSFKLTSPSGLWVKTTASTDTLAITGSTTQTLAVTNNGLWEAPVQCKFTPTAQETLFSCWIADNFGFILEKTSFSASTQIIYDTEDNSLLIGNEEQQVSQFLTGGGTFNVPPGASTLYVQCSGPGAFAYSYYERYL